MEVRLVLIAGAGPAGIAAALALSRAGRPFRWVSPGRCADGALRAGEPGRAWCRAQGLPSPPGLTRGALRAHATRSAGIPVERGLVRAATPTDAGWRVDLEGPAGAERVEVGLLVDATGTTRCIARTRSRRLAHPEDPAWWRSEPMGGPGWLAVGAASLGFAPWAPAALDDALARTAAGVEAAVAGAPLAAWGATRLAAWAAARRDRAPVGLGPALQPAAPDEPVREEEPGRTGGTLGPSGRRFHLVGLGLAKTGTTSLAARFVRYRWGHEAGFAATAAWLAGASNLPLAERVAVWRARDAADPLEMDSTSFAGMDAEAVVAAFPEARFVYTWREAAGWVDAWLNLLLRNGQRWGDRPWPAWQRAYGGALVPGFDPAWFRSPETVARHLDALVPPLLDHWETHGRRLIEVAPADRTLVLRTDELSRAASDLARLAGVPPDTLDGPAHANRAAGKVRFLDARPALREEADARTARVLPALDAWARRAGSPPLALTPTRGTPAARVELFIASGCSLHCYFCCESARIAERRFLPWEEVERRLERAAASGVKVVQWMGGEATLHPRFPDALRRARELGLSTYVITNLLRWEDRAFAEAVAPWLDEVMVSQHAWGATAGARVTGRPGWWDHYRAALRNARETLRARVRASTVLSRHSVDDLERIAEDLLSLRPHAWVVGLGVPIAEARLDVLDESLRLEAVRALGPRLEALAARVEAAGCTLIPFCIPHCLLAPGLRDRAHDLVVDHQDLAEEASLTVNFWSQADYLDRPRPVTLGRRRPAACAGCARASKCGGYFSAYFERFGDGELSPIR